MPIPEDEGGREESKTVKAKNEIGVKKAREIGKVGEAHEVKDTRKAQKTKAHKAAYFNEDISGVRQTNFNKSMVKKLRGTEGVTDLKKIVIPPAIDVDTPEPDVLRGVISLMGFDGGFNEELQGLLGRHGAWAQGQGVSVEDIKERMEQLERMVEDRRIALARMNDANPAKMSTCATLAHAQEVQGDGVDQSEDVASDGTQLVQRTAAQAEGLHQRIAKMLGLKIT